MTTLLQHDTDWLNHFQFSPTDPSSALVYERPRLWAVD